MIIFFKSRNRLAGDGRRGFTLIELMMVVMIILVLAAMAAVRYERSLLLAREATLKSDLRTMRDALQQYTLDKEAAPQSVDDLVSAGYLREVPVDPITHTHEWHADFDSVLLSPDQTGSGMSDVHSTSNATSLEGTPYNTW